MKGSAPPCRLCPAYADSRGAYLLKEREDCVLFLDRKLNQGAKKKKRLYKVCAYLAVVLTVSSLLSLFIVSAANDMFALVKKDADAVIIFGGETTIDEAADILAENGIIKNRPAFSLYARAKGIKTIPPGSAELSSQYPYDRIIDEITRERR